MELNYAVIGTGALGGFYGGKLANSGREVHFLLRKDYEYVKRNGLLIDSVDGNFHLPKILSYLRTSDMPACDVVLVCLKTITNKHLKTLLPPLLHSKSIIVLIQNGLGAEEEVAEDFPENDVAGGLAFICSHKKGPGYISHLDYGHLNIGPYRSQDPERLEQVCHDFRNAGISADLSDNLGFLRWQKLVWNVPFNGMTVVLNTTTDRLMSHEATRHLSHELMLEVVQGANHCGFAIEEEFAEKMMLFTEKMTPYAPSMKLDYDFRRPMEIEYIYSRPVATALNAGYQMKKVSMLEKQLRFLESCCEMNQPQD